MLQSQASSRGPEITDSRANATLGDLRAERESRRWRTWLPVPVATVVCLGMHWFISKNEPRTETLSYFRFLWSVLAVALVLAAAQVALPLLRGWMRRMGPIFAAALLMLALWELITSGVRWLPLPYFPSPAGVFQSLINDRSLLFDSTW